MTKFLLSLILAVATLAVGLPVKAAIIVPKRCEQPPMNADNLDIPKATERFAWGRKCFPAIYFMIIGNGDLCFMDSSNNSCVQGYPVIGRLDANGNVTEVWPEAPVDRNVGCEGIPEGMQIVGFCAGGCYTGDQKISMIDGAKPIDSIAPLEQIITLSENATFENVSLRSAPVRQVISSFAEGWHDIYFLKMQSGGSLKVTDNHPLVDATGTMRQAQNLKVGDALVKIDGSLDPIANVEVIKHYGKVYNVDVSAKSLVEQIVVAQGYLNGTVYYQNQGVDQINRRILRHANPYLSKIMSR